MRGVLESRLQLLGPSLVDAVVSSNRETRKLLTMMAVLDGNWRPN